jgi:HK97 family phage portal protein
MFISRLRSAGSVRASTADRSPWGDFWFTPVGSRTSTGQHITADGALHLGAVYACVRVLTESFAVLPFRLYRPRANGRGREVLRDHWAYRLFARRPNRFQTPFEWREMLQGHLTLRGNAFCEIVEDGAGGIAELLPRHPDRMKIEMLSSENWRYLYTTPEGDTLRYRRDQIFHVRGLSGDGIVGLNPIEMAREAIAAGLGAQEYGNRFWMNDAKPSGGWIEYPGKIVDRATRENLAESIRSAISGQNRHRILTLDQGMKYHEVGMSNRDSQFLEARGYNRSEIAGLFRVPPHMIGDLSRATFSNIEQQSIEFWQNTMLPWCERWEAAIEALIDDESLEVELDFRNLLRGDSVSRAQYAHNGVLDGWLTRNEARALEGYDPIDGLDEPLVPTNERELSEEPEETEEAEEVEAPEMDDLEEADGAAMTGPAPLALRARLEGLLSAQANRLARRAVGALSKKAAADVFNVDFEQLVQEAMGLDSAQAQQCCEQLQASGDLTEAAIAQQLLRCALQDLMGTT